MIDLDLVNCPSDFLRDRLSSDPVKRTGTVDQQKQVDDMVRRIRSRVQEGMSRNLADWQWIYAIDQALNTPFRQFHPKLFANLDNDNLQSCCKILKDLNMGSLVTTTKSADGKEQCSLNEDNFTILVGLVTSYTKARWAKIVNDRRLTPFLKYEPAKVTTINRAKCEVLTDRVQVMSDQYSYFDVMKQSTFKMLAYSFALQVIKEEWHVEEQLKHADDQDVERSRNADGVATKKAGETITFTVKEGLRYDIPHPSRIYRDLAHGLYTINSDSGCQFFGHWQIVRYRELLNSGFWNTDKVSLGTGTNQLIDPQNLYFQTAYNVCKLAAPVSVTAAPAVAQIGGGATNDLQTALANQWYGTDHYDQGALITNHFEKLVPKDNGLSDYPHPVWFRFVLAGDACTVLYAASLPGIPGMYYGYDADESRQKNASLAMEILPYQYEFENLLSQIIYSCKQNLSNLTLVNTDMLDDGKIDEINGWGPKLWKKLNIVGASFKKLMRLQTAARSSQDMGISLSLPKSNIAELVNVLKTILDVLERALGMSNQEVAQAASHEQTREEVRNIATSTTSRLTFTATPVDIARDAWKRQIYCYLMAYGDDDFYGHIPADNEITTDQLAALGFTFVDHDEMAGKEKYRRVRASKASLALPLYEFAATRDGEDRTSDSAIASVMATLARDVMANPITAAAIGPDQAISMINAIGYFAGLPRDFKLRNIGKTPEQQQAEAQQQLKQVVDITLQAADQHIIKAITPLLEEVKKLGQEVALLMRLAGAAPPPESGAGVPPPPPQPSAAMPMGVPPPEMMAQGGSPPGMPPVGA